MSFSDSVLPSAERAVGLPLATALATDRAEERKFILTTLVTAGTIYLLHRYFDHFLKGAGFDDMAERHGKVATDLMEAVRAGKGVDEAIAAAKTSLDESAATVAAKKIDPATREEAIAIVAELLRGSGAPPTQAQDVARALSEQVTTHLR